MNDALADVWQFAVHSLHRAGIAQPEPIADTLIEDLCRQLGGQTIYINYGFQWRNRRIRQEYNGRNAAKLAAQYGLSRQRIHQIIRQ
jgi:Mor family transcriptional regulator